MARYKNSMLAGISGISLLIGAYGAHNASLSYKSEADKFDDNHVWYACVCEGKNQAHLEYAEFSNAAKKAKAGESILVMLSGVMFTIAGISLANKKKLEEKVKEKK